MFVILDASAGLSCCTQRSVSPHSTVCCKIYAVYIGLFILQSELSRVQFEAKMCQGVSATRLFMFVIRVPFTVSLCAVCCCPLN